MVSAKLKAFLDAAGVATTVLPHRPTWTAAETAVATQVPRKDLAKAVIVKIDDVMAMAIVPASRKLDVSRLRDEAGARKVVLASEEEFRGRFPECEVGAMPIFGSLYGLDVWADAALAEDEDIVFNAGTHTEAMRVAWREFVRVARPRIARLTHRAAEVV